MSTAQKVAHTPGPWIVEGLNVFAEDDRWVASIHPEGTGVFRGHDNARLIAAAPDLLEACEALTEIGTTDKHGGIIIGPRGWEMVQAAIAKARGA